MDATSDVSCAVAGGVMDVEAGKGAGVKAVGVTGEADVAVDGGAGVGVGDKNGVVEEGVSKALVLSMTAT